MVLLSRVLRSTLKKTLFSDLKIVVETEVKLEIRLCLYPRDLTLYPYSFWRLVAAFSIRDVAMMIVKFLVYSWSVFSATLKIGGV